MPPLSSGSISVGIPLADHSALPAQPVGTGALLFARASEDVGNPDAKVLSSDYTKLVFDRVTGRLGIGGVDPWAKLVLSPSTSTKDAGMGMGGGSALTPAGSVAGAGLGVFRYNEVVGKFQVSLEGAAYVDIQTGPDFALDIGESIGGSTAGSLLFVGAGALFQQNNAKVFWDNTNAKLGIGTATPSTTLDLISATTTVGLAMAAGSTTAVSAANTGRLRYNEASGQKFQVSANGAAYVDAAMLAAPLTTGSVTFANASGQVSQSVNLLWDDGTSFLDIGGDVNVTANLTHGGVQVLGEQGAAVPDAVDGTVIDYEAREAVNTLLARLRAATGHGLIA